MNKKIIESYIVDFLSIKYDCNKEVFSKEGLNIIKNKTNNRPVRQAFSFKINKNMVLLY